MPITIAAVIPTCNRPELLARSFSSVLGQSSPADEIIIADNGTDPVPDGAVPDEVTLIRIAPRVGVSAARNAGAATATCEYVAFLDDDDYWDVDYLSEVRLVIVESGCTADVVLARKDRELDGVVSRYKEVTSLNGLREQLMVRNPGTGGQNIVVRREFFERVGGFRTCLKTGEDRALIVDAIDQGAQVVLAPRAIAVKVFHSGEQITDGSHSLSGTWRFLCIYWRTMNRRQLWKNVQRLCKSAARSLRGWASRPFQSRY